MDNLSEMTGEHVLTSEEISKHNEMLASVPRKNMELNADLKEEEVAVEEILPLSSGDFSIEDCTQKFKSLPAKVDVKEPVTLENRDSSASVTDIALTQDITEGASHITSPPKIPSAFETNEAWDEVPDAFPEEGSLPEIQSAPDTCEPSWGEVPDEAAGERTPRTAKRSRIAPECIEVDDVVQTMRNILFNLTYKDDDQLNPVDEEKVRDLLKYHPRAEEKTGCGIDHIKIKRHSTFKDVRCFWAVRTDGTETDFSYHKCLKEKVAKDHPSFIDRYDAIYRAKRPREA